MPPPSIIRMFQYYSLCYEVVGYHSLAHSASIYCRDWKAQNPHFPGSLVVRVHNVKSILLIRCICVEFHFRNQLSRGKHSGEAHFSRTVTADAVKPHSCQFYHQFPYSEVWEREVCSCRQEFWWQLLVPRPHEDSVLLELRVEAWLLTVAGGAGLLVGQVFSVDLGNIPREACTSSSKLIHTQFIPCINSLSLFCKWTDKIG